MIKKEEHRDISINKDIYGSLRRKELMFDSSPLGCSLWDEDLNQTDANMEMVNLFGLKSKQEYHDRFSDLSPEYQPDGSRSSDFVQKKLKEAFKEGYTQFEHMHQKLDGTLIPCEITLIRIRTDNGNNVAGYIRDLREHNQLIEKITEQRKTLETINQAASILLEADMVNIENTLFTVMGIIARAINVDRLAIWENRPWEELIKCSLTYEWVNDELRRGESDNLVILSYDDIPDVKDALAKGQHINKAISEMHPNTQKHMKQRGILSVFLSPIIIKDGLWGFIAYDNCHDEKTYSTDDETILQSVSRMIANALIRDEMTTEIVAAREMAEQSNRTKSEFLAKMSHEIRTPMNAILGMIELALREDMSDIVREHATMVKQAGVNLLSIINDILDISKIESGNVQVVPTGYLLSSLINDVVSIIRMRSVDSRLRFVVRLDSNLPNALIGDETRIRQILTNILGNAVKYTNKGFVSFTITGKWENDKAIDLIMEIKDSGRGIRKKDLKYIFNNYYQPDLESSKASDGVGLGLAISHYLIKAMDGEIDVDSEYGKGSTFTVTLPQKIYDAEKLATVSDPKNKRTLIFERRGINADSVIYTLVNLGVDYKLAINDKQFHNMIESETFDYIFISNALFEATRDAVMKLSDKTQIVLLTEFGESAPVGNWSVLSMPVHAISAANILNGVSDNFSYSSGEAFSVRFTAPEARVLVVDDINTNLKVVNGLLKPYMMEIDLCNSGYEAIEAVKEKRYDIVFMDHRMPEMDGVEATKRIRALADKKPFYHDLPIIALTANAVVGMKEMFLSNGFDDFLSKPIDTVRLNTLLEKWVPKEKQHGSVNNKKYDDQASSPVNIKIAGVNTNKGVKLSGGVVEYYYEILATFYEDWLERRKEIKNCLDDGNIPMYTSNVHALKGAAATIGADNLSEAANALEVAGIHNDLVYIKENNDNALLMLKELLEGIDTAISSKETDDAEDDKDEADKDAEAKTLIEELKELKSALEVYDFEEINKAVDELSVSARTDNDKKLVKKISRHVMLVEYEEISALIDSYIS